MNIFLEFFKPYFVFLFTGGHSLIEVSSVLNLITTSNGIYLYDRNFLGVLEILCQSDRIYSKGLNNESNT